MAETMNITIKDKNTVFNTELQISSNSNSKARYYAYAEKFQKLSKEGK